MNCSPKVSVIVPAFNAEHFIAGAIHSVLGQSYSPTEILVVDDGSTDGTRDVVRGFGGSVRLIPQENGGVSAARNVGAAHASGALLVFLDADDELFPNALQTLAAQFDGKPASHFCHGQVVDFDDDTETESPRPYADFSAAAGGAWRTFYNNGSVPPSAFMVTRALHDAVGGYDASFSYAADLHYWMRCGALASCSAVDAQVLRYRVHAESMSGNILNAMRENVDARLAFHQWCIDRDLCSDEMKSESEVIDRLIKLYFWRRRDDIVRALLAIADSRGISTSTVRRVRRLSKMPRFVLRIKDWMDRSQLVRV